MRVFSTTTDFVKMLHPLLASINYKLRLNGGDVKAVQGNSGHSQARMVTDVYAHIIDDDRKANAMLFQQALRKGY